MVARDDAVGDLFRDNGCADREAITKGFGGGEDIWVCGGGEDLVGPEVAGSREAALDFVVDEDCANFIAAVPEGLEKGGCGDIDATLTLNGLDDYAASILCDQLVDAGFVVVCSVLEAGYHGRERFLVFWVRGCG